MEETGEENLKIEKKVPPYNLYAYAAICLCRDCHHSLVYNNKNKIKNQTVRLKESMLITNSNKVEGFPLQEREFFQNSSCIFFLLFRQYLVCFSETKVISTIAEYQDL